MDPAYRGNDNEMQPSSLQAHHSADKYLARCLHSDGVFQAVTFGYRSNLLISSSCSSSITVGQQDENSVCGV